MSEYLNLDTEQREKDGTKRYWTILFVGRNAESSADGVFVWKLRDELKAALRNVDFSDTQLYAERSDMDTNGTNYWWLNANPKIWSFADIDVGEEQNYTMYNENGNKRRIFKIFWQQRRAMLLSDMSRIRSKKSLHCAGLQNAMMAKICILKKRKN